MYKLFCPFWGSWIAEVPADVVILCQFLQPGLDRILLYQQSSVNKVSLVVGRVHRRPWQSQEWLLSVPTAKKASVTHIAGLLVRKTVYGVVLAWTRCPDTWDSWLRGEPSSGSWKNCSLYLQAEAAHTEGALGSWDKAQAHVKRKLWKLNPKSKYAVTQSVRRLARVWLPYEVTCWHVLSNSLACLLLVSGILSWVTTGPTAWLGGGASTVQETIFLMKPKAHSPGLLMSPCLLYHLQGWAGRHFPWVFDRLGETFWGLHITVEVRNIYLSSARSEKLNSLPEFWRPREMASLTGATLGQLQYSALSQHSRFRALCNRFVSLAEFLKHTQPLVKLSGPSPKS